jgi:hypothetical protein
MIYMDSQEYDTAVETAVADAAVLGSVGEAEQAETWPAEARMILSAIKAGEGAVGVNRRNQARLSYEVCGELRLFSDVEGSAPWPIYTRDASSRSVGFISPHRLPLGYGGVVELPAADGKTISAHCTLFRCRQTARGWYEGALSFHRPQWELARPDELAEENHRIRPA